MFQLVISGLVVGDEDPCILGSMMNRLLTVQDQPEVPNLPATADARRLVDWLGAHERESDQARIGAAESLDDWDVWALVSAGDVVVVAERSGGVEVTSCRLPVAEFGAVVSRAVGYWRAEVG